MDKRLKQLQDQLVKLDAELKGMLAAAVDENGATRAMTDAEKSAYDARDKQAELVAGQIKEEQKIRDRQVTAKLGMQVVTGADAVTPEQAAALNGRSADEPKVRERWIEDPKKGFKTPREFMTAVMRAGKGQSLAAGVQERLSYLRAANANGYMATVGSDEQSGVSDPHGGFLVPVGFSPDLLSVKADADPIGMLVRSIPMSSPTVPFNARVDKNHSTSVSGGLTVTRRPETVAGTASRMAFEQITLQAHSMFGLAYATEEILTDSPMSFVALLEQGFSEEFAARFLQERLFGTGIGEFLGVMNAACLVSVAKETGQAGATIVKENIDKMQSRCWGYGNAVWLANQNTLPQLKSLSQTVGTGGAPVPYYTEVASGMDANGLPRTQAMLAGRPIFFTEFCKTLGTTGDLVLGNWREYLEGTLQPLEMAESIHVRFVNHERAFKFWLRNDARPWWSSVLTPVNGSTLSPFVALDTRA